MHLPPELATQLAGYAFAPVQLGQSGAAVWHCTREACSPRYLKVASRGADLLLHGEAARLRWMREHGASVPAVRAYVCRDDVEYRETVD